MQYRYAAIFGPPSSRVDGLCAWVSVSRRLGKKGIITICVTCGILELPELGSADEHGGASVGLQSDLRRRRVLTTQYYHAVCPRSLGHVYIGAWHIKINKTSWTPSTIEFSVSNLIWKEMGIYTKGMNQYLIKSSSLCPVNAQYGGSEKSIHTFLTDAAFISIWSSQF